MFGYLGLVLVVVIFIHCYIHYFNRKGRLINKIPGLPIVPLVGNLFDFMNTPFGKSIQIFLKKKNCHVII